MGVFYRLRYLLNSYTLADAFRPQPGWGSKVFRVEAGDLGPHTDDDVVKAATESAPPGYWLQTVEAIGGEQHVRQIMCKPVRSAAPTSSEGG